MQQAETTEPKHSNFLRQCSQLVHSESLRQINSQSDILIFVGPAKLPPITPLMRVVARASSVHTSVISSRQMVHCLNCGVTSQGSGRCMRAEAHPNAPIMNTFLPSSLFPRPAEKGNIDGPPDSANQFTAPFFADPDQSEKTRRRRKGPPAPTRPNPEPEKE